MKDGIVVDAKDLSPAKNMKKMMGYVQIIKKHTRN